MGGEEKTPLGQPVNPLWQEVFQVHELKQSGVLSGRVVTIINETEEPGVRGILYPPGVQFEEDGKIVNLLGEEALTAQKAAQDLLERGEVKDLDEAMVVVLSQLPRFAEWWK